MAHFKKRQRSLMEQQFKRHIRRRRNNIPLTLTGSNFKKAHERPQFYRPSMSFASRVNQSDLNFEEKLADFLIDKERLNEFKNRRFEGLRKERKEATAQRIQERG